MKNILLYINTLPGFISASCAFKTVNPYPQEPLHITLLCHWTGPESPEIRKQMGSIIGKFKDTVDFPNNTVWMENEVMHSANSELILRTLSEKLNAEGKAIKYDEIYFAHDVNNNLYPYLCELFPESIRICYGDGFGSLHKRHSRLSEIGYPVDDGLTRPSPDRVVAILPVDYYGNFVKSGRLTVCSKHLFMSEVANLISGLTELKNYLKDLLAAYKGRKKYILITENYAEAKRISEEKDLMMYCSILHRFTKPGDVVFIKPHPGEVIDKSVILRTHLNDSREIVGIDKNFARYPVELWEDFLLACQPICMTIPVLTIKYMYDIDVIQPLSEEFIRFWFNKPFWDRVRSTLHTYKMAVENLQNWDGDSLLYSKDDSHETEILRGLTYVEEEYRTFYNTIIKKLLELERVVLAGSGRHTEQLLHLYPMLVNKVQYIVTNTVNKNMIRNIPIIHENQLKSIDFDAILISSEPYETAIAERLFEMGVPDRKIYTLYNDKDRLLDTFRHFNTQKKTGELVKPVIALFGHHKGATMWLCAIFNAVAHHLKFRNRNFWDSKLFDFDLKTYLIQHKIQVFSYTNADYRYVEAIADKVKGFHVIRDPRDICVSAYFSHLYSHPTDVWPELNQHRKKLQDTSKDQGLFLEMDFRAQEFKEMLEWRYDNPNIMELKLESLAQNDVGNFLEIFEFLGLLETGDTVKSGIPMQKLVEIVLNNRFAEKSGGRKKGEEDPHNHYRKGIPGDWKNHFNDEHVLYFKKKYNKLLLKLGYENDENW